MRHSYIYMCVFTFLYLVSCTHKYKNNAKSEDTNSGNIVIEDSTNSCDSISHEYDTLKNDSVRLEELRQASVVSAHGEFSRTEVNRKFVLDKDGIGVIKLGTNINDLPNKYDGLYDFKKLSSNGMGGKLCLVYSKKEQIVEIDYDNKTNIINSIRITSPSIKTIDGICQFMSYGAIIKSDKVKALLQGKGDVYNFVLNGVKYELEENIKGNKYVSAIVVTK